MVLSTRVNKRRKEYSECEQQVQGMEGGLGSSRVTLIGLLLIN